MQDLEARVTALESALRSRNERLDDLESRAQNLRARMNEPIYRGFTRGELDKQYSPSAWSPRPNTVDVHCENLADHSALVRDHLQHHPGALERGVRYGNHAMHTIDFYHPPGGPSTASPLCVYLHGGYWTALSAAASGWFAPALQQPNGEGATVVAIEYPLTPASSFGFLVQSVRQAVAFVALRHPNQRLVLLGHSAGGHLCGLVLSTSTSQWAAAASAATPYLPTCAEAAVAPAPSDWVPRVDGAMLVSGVFDLEPIRLSCVDEPLHLELSDVISKSPTLLLAQALRDGWGTGADVCTLSDRDRVLCSDNIVVAVAERDSPEFRRQSAEYAHHLQRAQRERQRSLKVKYLDVDNTCHFDIVEKLCSAGSTPQAYVLLDALRELIYPPDIHGSISPHRFHLISGMQHGADRGAVLGIDRARMRGISAPGRNLKGGATIGGVSTGGYMPLGFKCDDYIQESTLDKSTEAYDSVRKERKWVDDPMCEKMRDYIERFGMIERPSKAHKVSFKDKDMGNADESDILIAFRADVPNSGAGTEQTLNYALFGEYVFVEQFRNGKQAGGALLRDDLITNPGDGVRWCESQCRQRRPLPGCGDALCPHLEFHRGREYCVWKTFTHTTSKDEVRTAKEGRDCFKMEPVTAAQLSHGEQDREWEMQKARRSAISFVLKQCDSRDTEGAYDAEIVHQICAFVRNVESEWCNELLRIMVTGPTEKVQPRVEERTAKIFEDAFGALLDAPRPPASI